MKEIALKKVELSNGETLGYREREGGEEIVVLIHGNMTSSKHWDLVLETMDDRYKLYAVDMRGFGISTYHKPIESIKDFSDDLKLFTDKLGLKNFSLIGWSTGGAVAQQFCADYPDECQRMILLASASTRGYPFYATGEDGMPDVNRRLTTLEDVKADKGKTVAVQTAYDIENRDFLKAMWNMLIYTDHQPEQERYEEYVDDMLTQRNLAEVYQALNTFNISDKHNGLKQGNGQVNDIEVPVLVLRGENDLVVTDKMTKEIVADFGDQATFVELKGAGHSPLVDDLGGLLQLIERFLQKKERQNDEITG